MNFNQERQGGSYRLDAESGALTCVERTEDHPEGNAPRNADGTIVGAVQAVAADSTVTDPVAVTIAAPVVTTSPSSANSVVDAATNGATTTTTDTAASTGDASGSAGDASGTDGQVTSVFRKNK